MVRVAAAVLMVLGCGPTSGAAPNAVPVVEPAAEPKATSEPIPVMQDLAPEFRQFLAAGQLVELISGECRAWTVEIEDSGDRLTGRLVRSYREGSATVTAERSFGVGARHISLGSIRFGYKYDSNAPRGGGVSGGVQPCIVAAAVYRPLSESTWSIGSSGRVWSRNASTCAAARQTTATGPSC